MVAIDFSGTPSDGDKNGQFKYQSSSQTWKKLQSQSFMDIGDVTGSASNNNVVAYNESTSKWEVKSVAIPTGYIFEFAGSTIPSGYLECNGGSFSSSTYPELATVLGDVYGIHSGTTYYLPNISGRSPYPKDTLALGSTGGEKNVVLIEANLPSHNHTQRPHNHIQDAHNHTQNAHSHGVSIPFYPSGWEAGGYGTGYYGAFRDRTVVGYGGWGMGSDGRQPAISTNTATNQNTTATNQNTGGGQGHNNMMPYVVLKYIIKT